MILTLKGERFVLVVLLVQIAKRKGFLTHGQNRLVPLSLSLEHIYYSPIRNELLVLLRRIGSDRSERFTNH